MTVRTSSVVDCYYVFYTMCVYISLSNPALQLQDPNKRLL